VSAALCLAAAIPVVKNNFGFRFIRAKKSVPYALFIREETTMEKEVETASEMVNPELSGGLHSYKEAVYNSLGNFFEWLATHQGLALIFMIIILGIIVWLILRAKKYRKQFENEVSIKKKEIGKKEALIEEKEKKLTGLQKKLSDQQGVVSEALLGTIRTLTGYDADQLPIFFKSLTQITRNPLQMADPRAITAPESQRPEGERDVSSGINDSKEKLVSDDDFSEKNDAKEAIASGDDSSEENDAKKEKLASDDGPDEAADTKKTGK
jgi:hypothetical protein